MDRNTLIGLGLIGVILALFTYFNQPSPEEIKAQQEKIELAEKKAKERKAFEAEEKKKEETAITVQTGTLVPKKNEKGEIVTDSLGRKVYTDTITKRDTILAESSAIPVSEESMKPADEELKGEIHTIENDKLKIEISTKGGGVSTVYLKEHQTYEAFQKNQGKDKIDPLKLFDNKASVNQLVFPLNGNSVETGKQIFEVVKQSESEIFLEKDFGNNQKIVFMYSLQPGDYHMAYEVKMKGFEGKVLPENVMLDWESELLKTERLLSEQRRTSTVFFKGYNDSYDYLSEYSDDQYSPEMDVEWVAFKQSYFSSMMMPEKPFKKEGTSFEVKGYQEGSEKDSTHIKQYSALMNLNIDNTANGYAAMKWYFGPNDYDLLASYENEAEDIINLGWGIFRWVNIYAIQPIFNWLAAFGMNLGLAILLLTIIVKIFLTPIQWKMYTSSAKMRILKPEIEELNKKYPNKEDAMKKQMEMMTMYRESGASPLAGCVPMLIQMPILFAVFRFFPSSFTLRQESFLWAEDLSSYDSVVDLGYNIPFYGDHVSLFTLLMAATTLIYTVLNSSNMQQPSQPGMPNMKVIMYIFPIMMIFFFNNFASGLSYYYFISTLMSILTMIMIKRFFVDEEKLKAKMASRKATKQAKGKAGSKSRFQERLEQMQKAQQEKLKNRK
ncbi:MAG: membrane protein insertase YidC [Brumimicrobium sp.]|nr:membrane protein insertase YidC [Brumimicrobium sp.]